MGEMAGALRNDGPPHDRAVGPLVSLDGVMMRMKGGDGQEAGWREAAGGVVARIDATGAMLRTRHFARLPEPGEARLKARPGQEVWRWMKRAAACGGTLRIHTVADGARDNRPFPESFGPDAMLVDLWHGAEHLKAAADAAFGPDTAAGTAWFEKQRHSLRHAADGAGKVIDAPRHLKRQGRGTAAIDREIGYFRTNRKRMSYKAAADAGAPIGSGTVECANKTLVNLRMKRAGQRWGRDGGQGVLTFRALLKSDRCDSAWKIIADTWRTPYPGTCANRDQPPPALAA